MTDLRLLRVENADDVRDRQAYLYRIASHVIYEFRMRARQARVSFDSDAVDELAERLAGDSAEDLAERLNTQQQLERLLAELPPLCRAVFLLQKQEGLTYEEVADKLGISVHAVQRYLFKALAALRSAHWG